MATNVSADLIWEITRAQNAFVCKRRTGGGVQFSRDPLNLTNVHSRKYEGFVNDKAIGVQAGENGAVVLTTKTTKANKPAAAYHKTSFGANTSSRKVYKAIASTTAKRGYRADLRAAAISRASAIKQSQKPVKADRPAKLRGAKKAAASA